MESPQFNTPKEALAHMMKKSGAITALLITKEGNTVAETGDTSYMNTTAMAALIAAMFSATREVARLVGEKQFSVLLQQGESRHIHISLVTDWAMMVVVFDDYRKVGMIRLAARKTGEEIQGLLQQNDKRKRVEEHIELAAPAFKEFALNLIDRIFEDK